MISQLKIDDAILSIRADHIRVIAGGMIASGEDVSLELPFQPARYYRSGWQSWSPTGWVDATTPFEPPYPTIMHSMQSDPAYVFNEKPNGSWMGAIESPGGNVVILGALGLESRVELDEQILLGRYAAGQCNGVRCLHEASLKGQTSELTGIIGVHPAEWFIASGSECKVFARYAELLGKQFGTKRAAKPPRVWCSWYSLFTAITEARLLHILDELGDLPFDVFQIDDGWQKSIGDWEPNEKFPSGMESLAARIHATGRTAGLWLAPLLAVPSSTIYRDHREWLLHDERGELVSAGYNWSEPLYALDLTHSAALDWLAALMKRVSAWGYDYFKLDFLYAGALPGIRTNGMPRETAYRNGLAVIREALGHAYILTCGAPILPSLGLCDGMRLGPDVASYWNSNRDSRLLNNMAMPGARNAIFTTLHRLWLMPLIHADSDVVYFRTRQNNLSLKQMQLLQDLASITGFKATSDLPAWLNPSERASLDLFLKTNPLIKQTGHYTFKIDDRSVDFSTVLPLPDELTSTEKIKAAFVRRLANQPIVISAFDRLFRYLLARSLRET